ncbi:MAG: Gfo/Idh/MocA family oxidoreductase [Clostridia bacterium]|nr:Gfo/Idh/MocA family oxidoreductase [Clostridia bacterium]
MNNEVRLAVIGIGSMGSSHVIQLCEGKVHFCRVTAVCDINPARLDWARQNYPEIACYEDYHDVLASDDVDAVLIATPHYLHPEIGIEALEAGKHVLSEKPIGVYTKRVVDFIEVAQKAKKEKGLVFACMFNQRPEPHYRKIRQMVQSGALGELKRFVWIITNWYRTQDYYNSGGWRATYAGEGGGVLINQCPHNIDLWQWMLGMPKRVRAFTYEGKYHDIEVEDDVTAYCEYENGMTGTFITSTGECPGTNRLEITGSKGKLVYENGKLMFTKLAMDEREFCFNADGGFSSIDHTTEEIIPPGMNKGHRTIIQNFTDAILFGTPLIAPGEEGINSLSLSNAMVLSSWTDKWVDVPNDGEEYWKLLQERIKTSKVKENVVDKVADLSNTFNTK